MTVQKTLILCACLLTACPLIACSPGAGGRAPVASDGPPPAPMAMAKRAPPQPGELVSPLIAFSGEVDGAALQIENAGGYAQRFEWDDGSGEPLAGTLQYRPPSSGGDASVIELRGTLNGAGGERAATVLIRANACTDAAGRRYTHSLRLELAGAPARNGCGDLAK